MKGKVWRVRVTTIIMEFKNSTITFENNLDQWAAPWRLLTEYKSLNSNQLAQHTKRISANYQNDSQNTKSNWAQNGFTEAYLAYFLPLNTLRLKAVLQEGQRLGFFEGLQNVADVGSGCGALPLAFTELDNAFYQQFQTWSFIEQDPRAIEVHKRLSTAYAIENKKWQWQNELKYKASVDKTLTVFSYSLNEIETDFFESTQSEALMIVEPSTRNCGRRLQELRQKLIEKGYSIWAPCTHHESCPLLAHSQKDWCHQRIHIELPDELMEIHNLLPMKNQTLTYSYLLARKKPRPLKTEQQEARVIGDTLYEKGKVRQAICRSTEREFLSWLTKAGEPEPIARGTLLPMDFPFEKKGDELRVKVTN